MKIDHRAILANIKRFDQLIAYLRNEMGWPIGSSDFEELTFEYTPEELGIDEKNAAKIESIKRLRPLSLRQPWGIFFVKFEPKRLPVVVLRRILSKVTLKKRASANSAERTAWAANDLLFISNYGVGDERTITFAHFSHDDTKQDLPVLKVLGWNDEDTALHLDGIASELTSKLAWPDNESDAQIWRKQWRSAFTVRHGEVIATSKVLSIHLAKLAQTIRNRINKALIIETEHGPLKTLMKAFQNALIHDLDADGFADMYAQTIAYGLLSARITNPRSGTADDLHMQIPVTNPFLKELMEMFLHVSGRRGKAGGPGMDFDELGISEVVELLDEAKMESVIRDFGDRNPLEDPVIHFYELFLKEYDAKKRLRRGVFYTPRPVVSYIIRSVDELLRTKFGLQDGLADTTTWGEMVKLHQDLKIPKGISSNQVFVQILDPATGTGTFLVETIDLIHRTMRKKWKGQGQDEKKIEESWNEYVPKYLLPRLHGYEILMAPYAIAHLKIGLKLHETGYKFNSQERVRIYLTNSLEPAVDIKQLSLTGTLKAIANEAQAVNKIKRQERFTVVIGNPPYSGISSNMSDNAQKLVDAYRILDGKQLKERKIWLQDDYVKFIRIAQMTLEQTNVGVLGYVTNHGYIDNPTFRGMRRSLMNSFEMLSFLNLHGNTNKKEIAPDGSKDENVFDIRQGVAIFLAAKINMEKSIQYTDLWGIRNYKYNWLLSHNISNTPFEAFSPIPPYYFFTSNQITTDPSYDSFVPITKIFELYISGIITARDRLVLDFNLDELSQRIDEFSNEKFSDSDIKERFKLKENYMWRVTEARKELMAVENREQFFTKILYRPFNVRHIFFHSSVVWRQRIDIMKHMLKPNLALITTRQTRDPFGALVTRLISGHKSVARYDINSVFPLYIYQDLRDKEPNYTSTFIETLASVLSVPKNGESSLLPNYNSEDIFNYLYAILYSPGYRKRYAEHLRIDFPRLPYPGSHELFHSLSQLGNDLISLHTMESHELEKLITEFINSEKTEIEKVTYSNETIWINNVKTVGFKGVPEIVWNFHIGGFQVCEKWLKDRKGRTLSKEHVDHFQKIIVALAETIRIMKVIDDVIERHGGWPGAFHTSEEKTTTSQKGLLDF